MGNLKATDQKEKHLREQVRGSAIFISLMLFLISFYFVFFMGESPVAAFSALCSLMTLILVVRGALVRDSGASSFRLIVIGSLAVVSSSFFNSGLLGTSAFWLICIPLVAMEFLPKRAAVTALGLHLAILFVFTLVQMTQPGLISRYDTGRQWSLAILDHFGLFVTTTTLSYVAARSRRRLAEELSVSNLLLSRLLQLLGHDMVNAIGLIAMSQRRLAERFEQLPADVRDPQTVRLLSIMERQIGNLQALIEKSRQLAKWQSGRRLDTAAFSLQDAIEDAWALCKEAALKKGIRMDREGLENEIWVEADRVILIHEGLQNYFSNAVKFSPHAGRIWLRVTQEAGNVVVEIEDEGTGIPAEILRALEAKGDIHSHLGTDGEMGTGFGLSLARDLLHATGVTATLINKAESQGQFASPQSGTLVRMTVPVSSQKKNSALKSAA